MCFPRKPAQFTCARSDVPPHDVPPGQGQGRDLRTSPMEIPRAETLGHCSDDDEKDSEHPESPSGVQPSGYSRGGGLPGQYKGGEGGGRQGPYNDPGRDTLSGLYKVHHASQKPDPGRESLSGQHNGAGGESLVGKHHDPAGDTLSVECEDPQGGLSRQYKVHHTSEKPIPSEREGRDRDTLVKTSDSPDYPVGEGAEGGHSEEVDGQGCVTPNGNDLVAVSFRWGAEQAAGSNSVSLLATLFY